MTITLGLETFLAHPTGRIAGKRAGLVTNNTAIDHNLVSTVQRIHAHPAVNLVALFGPEHGLRGEAQDAEHVAVYTDALTGLPVYSLYGSIDKPTREMLEGLDVLLFDIQDAGVRFYTYISTLAHVMQAAAEQGIPVVVLDRPAPINGVMLEGPVLDPDYSSFVGLYPIPIRYGMTIGELAQLFNGAFGIGCDLSVAPLAGWSRAMWYDQTGLPFVPTSPNLPTLDAMTVYPGTCLFEGTNLSEGRGTTRPFEYIGAPWVRAEPLAAALNDRALPGARFRAVYFQPAFSKHQDQLCAGVHLYVTDRAVFRPVRTALYMIAVIKTMHPGDFTWQGADVHDGRYSIDRLSGNDAARAHLDAGGADAVDALIARWAEDRQAFEALRAGYLLYE
ncbi:MAG: DUF1343 domain-containing protein [Anaerolineae bacterium]|nr:DUF1343 domain-containing protein [Anaerolineae bacterium]